MPNIFVLVLTLRNVSHGIPHLICKWETSGEFHTMGLSTVNWSTNLFFPTRLIRLPAQTTMEIEIKLWNKRELLRGMYVLCWAHIVINMAVLVYSMVWACVIWSVRIRIRWLLIQCVFRQSLHLQICYSWAWVILSKTIKRARHYYQL